MDLIRKLSELNHTQVIQEELEKRFPISEDDTPDEILLQESIRQGFVTRYDKKNNRQFVKSKMYPMNEYRLKSVSTV